MSFGIVLAVLLIAPMLAIASGAVVAVACLGTDCDREKLRAVWGTIAQQR